MIAYLLIGALIALGTLGLVPWGMRWALRRRAHKVTVTRAEFEERVMAVMGVVQNLARLDIMLAHTQEIMRQYFRVVRGEGGKTE